MSGSNVNEDVFGVVKKVQKKWIILMRFKKWQTQKTNYSTQFNFMKLNKITIFKNFKNWTKLQSSNYLNSENVVIDNCELLIKYIVMYLFHVGSVC